ncbi:GRF1-interacting factor 2 [Picochlorum sp. SENEW3]|nr:GRF1-interacting factor 2 [Picochlorum sp. SENEW3]
MDQGRVPKPPVSAQAAEGHAGDTVPQSPAKILTTREIQQKLEENSMLLEAINERQNVNSLKDCVTYQKKLSSNLRELALLLESDKQQKPGETARQQ